MEWQIKKFNELSINELYDALKLRIDVFVVEQTCYYPDLDDTSMVAWAMHRTGNEKYKEPIERAAVWVAGMRSNGGGFGSFEVNNTQYYLNAIPFADHGALLDPPTADVTGRVIALLSLADKEKYATTISDAVEFLKMDQEEDVNK